ncbi:MAG: hypothetical protein ACRDRN_17735 [Sciscionella sp.]
MQPFGTPAPDRCPPGPQPERKAWRWAVTGVIIGACVIGAAWGATAAAGRLSGANTFTLHGSMSLKGGDDDVTTTAAGCAGSGGYSDISDGTAVTVYDAGGAVVATGDLTKATSDGAACMFDIQVPDVPVGSKFYQVEVSHRGKITVPAGDAESGTVSITLGS